MTRFRGEGFESSSYTEMVERVEVMGQRRGAGAAIATAVIAWSPKVAA
jgi:hypothetical protein